MAVKFLKRSIFRRIFGRSATNLPNDKECWTYSDGKVIIDLSRSPELSVAGGAIRLEGGNLPKRILVIHGDAAEYRAFHNCCGHGRRRLDPVPDSQTVQCCSMGKSTYDYNGEVLFGPTEREVMVFQVKADGEKIIITIE